MGEMTDQRAEHGREQAEHSDWLDKAIRVGLVAYGVVHLLIAWLALQLALGDHEGKPSSQGAMQQLAEQPYGEVLLWLIALGMFVLVLWRLLEAWLGHRDEEGAKTLVEARPTRSARPSSTARSAHRAARSPCGARLDGKGRSDDREAHGPAGRPVAVGLVGLGDHRSTAAT